VSTEGFGLTELELDALTEVVNIGVSRAATSLRDMVGQQVFLSVPSVAITSPIRAVELLGQRESSLLVAIRQGFQGEFSGSALLIFPEKNSLELVRAVAGDHLPLEDILELEQEALAEIGNVILNGCMATIANLLRPLVTATAPSLLGVHGVGVDCAAAVLVAAGDNPERLRSEAAWAHLCGVAPIPASSGKVTRWRLNRGGDRHANGALWVIVITRMNSDPRTRAYVERRLAEGKSKPEIIRILKRYVAREIYRHLPRHDG